ncbi:MAG: hypothetical protein E7666_07995 [Ruminococcaceae bacterium]|nr:hypothetical protein [Oscillospiraceae bacterium]
MNRKKNFLPRILAFCLTVALLLALGGCYQIRKRPTEPTQSAESESDIPAGADTDTQETAPKKRVAITFDDGPNHYDDRTKKYVDALDRYGFHATFFVVGNRIAGGDSIAYAAAHGNEIGIHGYTHSVYYDSCDDDVYHKEINKTAQAIREQIPGYEIKLMRPVGGKISDHRATTSPYAIILWNVDSHDWENRYYSGIPDEAADACVNTIVENVMSSVADGDIILLHDIYESTYDATLIILERLHAEGYEVVTVSELLADRLEGGRVYHSAYD